MLVSLVQFVALGGFGDCGYLQVVVNWRWWLWPCLQVHGGYGSVLVRIEVESDGEVATVMIEVLLFWYGVDGWFDC
jgi:hypothetical protein